MAEAQSQDLAVKRTAVKLLSTACDGLVAEDEPFAAALAAALRSPNDPLFIYNYGVAEQEFGRLPRETTETLLSRCQSKIAETQGDILAEFRGMSAAKRAAKWVQQQRKAKKAAESKKRITAIEWT